MQWAGEVGVMESDSVYFRKRALEEREAALNAPHDGARQAHLDMADRYDKLATAIASGEVVLNPVSPAPNSATR